jgi:hypothetical protein
MRRPTGWLIAATIVTLWASQALAAEVTVTTVDLRGRAGYEVNGIGPILVQADAARNRVIVANTLSSSVSIIDGTNDEVTTIPVDARGLQHLKAAALAVHALSGRVYLIGYRSLIVVDPDGGTSVTYPTEAQYESVVVDEASGNAFLVGRETGDIGFLSARARRFGTLPWLSHAEDLVNLNQTPPPPLRRVVAIPATDGGKARIAALDGFESKLYLFDAKRGRLLSSRSLPLQAGGRWHLAGLDASTGHVFVVTETSKREAIQAARIAVDGDDDLVIELPGYTEPVGMRYNPARQQLLLPYDNHATLHVVDFSADGALREIPIPAYGNDATALNADGTLLFIGSWAHGEVEVIDLEEEAFAGRYEDLGIIPHQHAMTFNAANGDLYFPVGATAVNGCFGAAVTRLDPETGSSRKIHTGFAPIDLVETSGRFLVFGNEDRFFEVFPDGRMRMHDLPHAWPTRALQGPDDVVYLIYGPHQSYWPTVYIWGARNGVLTIDPADLSTYDRRIPRQPLDPVVASDGALVMPQNNWGGENQFLTFLPDSVRVIDMRERLELPDEVTRETTQRLMRHDPATGELFLLRVGETDTDPSVLQVIDRADGEVTKRIEVGANATDLAFDANYLYVAAFGDGRVDLVARSTGSVQPIPTGGAPLRLCQIGGNTWVLDHVSNAVQQIGGTGTRWPLEIPGHADDLYAWGDDLVVIAHAPDKLTVTLLNPATGETSLALEHAYPFGDTRFDTPNSAFYMSGQYGDAVFHLTRGEVAADGALYLADFLSGQVFILTRAH